MSKKISDGSRPNQLPESKWPIKKGTEVWFLATGLTSGYPYVGKGKVAHYNPAHEGCATVSLDVPIYTIYFEGRPEIVYYKLVKRVTRSNRDWLIERLARHYDDMADSHRERCEDATAKAYKVRQSSKLSDKEFLAQRLDA